MGVKREREEGAWKGGDPSTGELEESERRKEMRWITFLPGREQGGSEGGETWVL